MKMFGSEAISAVHLGSPQTVRAFFRREVWHGASVFRVFLRDFPQVPEWQAHPFRSLYTA